MEFFFLYSSFTVWFVQSLDRQQGKRASIMQQNESQYIHEWIWVRCLKVYKNNGVCNIIPGTPNGSSLKGGMYRLPASRDLQPSLEYYKALSHYYSPLHTSLPSYCMDVSGFLCLCVYVGDKIMFFFSPSQLILTQLPRFACIRIANREAWVLISEDRTACTVWEKHRSDAHWIWHSIFYMHASPYTPACFSKQCSNRNRWIGKYVWGEKTKNKTKGQGTFHGR